MPAKRTTYQGRGRPRNTDRPYRLYLGTKFTGIVVAPDERYPSMFRVHWPDRPPSDMVNLSRAKDAATLWAQRAHPGQGRMLQWRQGARHGQ